MQRLTHFLYSRRSIVGSALAIAGLALHFVGLVTGPMWLPVVVGLYLIGVLLVPSERGLEFTLDAQSSADEIRRGLDRIVIQTRGRVALDIADRIGHIRDSILVTLDADGGKAAGDPAVRDIRQTALDYLPAALNAYLALPRAYAEGRTVAGGRTPHDALLEQLDLMDTKMREAADAILSHDSEALLANGRFLADRFATSALKIDAAPQTLAATPAATPAPSSVSQTEESARERVH
jgi:hypothetical protein